MKPFLKMNNTNMRIARNGVLFFKNSFFKKLFFYTVLFSSVFSAHFFYEGQSPEVLRLTAPMEAFASADPLSSKEGAGHQSLLDVNKASLDELMTLPGIGPKLADVILKDREANGPFQDADALLRVKGIGQKKLEKISPFLHFESAVK